MPRLVRWIWLLLALHLTIGMAAYAHYLVSGQVALLYRYFWLPGSIFFLVMTATECGLALVCCSWFDSDEPMRLAWGLIACAAFARFAGTLLRGLSSWHLSLSLGHWLSNPHIAGLDAGMDVTGMVVGGPLSMVFLAVGLGCVLRIQSRFGLMVPLTRGDWALLTLIIAFTASQIVFSFLPLLGRHPSRGTMLLWLSDPLLSLLLIEAVLVRRSVIRMGAGLVAQCWGMYAFAIVITSAGDASIWATSKSLLVEPLMFLSWFIWYVAAAAFACAPAYQLAAMSLIREECMQASGKR